MLASIPSSAREQQLATKGTCGLFGGCTLDIWDIAHGYEEDDASEFGYGRRFSSGDQRLDTLPMRIPITLHVYDLGTAKPCVSAQL